MIDHIKLLFWVSRPFLLPGMPLAFILGIYLAEGSLYRLPLIGFVQIASLTFPSSILAYGLNDIFDFESDQKNILKSKGFGEVLLPRYHNFVFRAAIICGALLMIVSFLTLSITNSILSLCLVALAVLYSVPPVQLKTKPPLDSLVNGLGYFFLPFALGFSYFLPLSEIPFEVIFILFTVMGLHMYASIRDYTYDKESGYTTISVAFGKKRVAFLASLTFLMPLLYLIQTRVLIPAIIFLSVGLSATLLTTIWPNERFVSVSFRVIFFSFIICIVWLFSIMK